MLIAKTIAMAMTRPMRMAATLYGDPDVEAVRLGDLIDGFPIGPVIGEQKDLTCSIRVQRLDPDQIGVNSAQTGAWRDACFIN